MRSRLTDTVASDVMSGLIERRYVVRHIYTGVDGFEKDSHVMRRTATQTQNAN